MLCEKHTINLFSTRIWYVRIDECLFSALQQIQYAQKKSRKVALLDGTYVSEEKGAQLKEREKAEEIANELSNKRKTETDAGMIGVGLSFALSRYFFLLTLQN
jgi:hypothetical protein